MRRSFGSAEGSSISISNSAREIVFANDAHLRLLQRPRHDVVGYNWQRYITPEGVAAVEIPLKAFWQTKRAYDVLTHALRPDGTLVMLVARCSMIHGETPDRDLLFCEAEPVEHFIAKPDAERLACAASVRDLTYELAARTGRARFADLTDALLAASASAERVVEMLGNVSEAVRHE